jgi:hypothetical protein
MLLACIKYNPVQKKINPLNTPEQAVEAGDSLIHNLIRKRKLQQEALIKIMASIVAKAVDPGRLTR